MASAASASAGRRAPATVQAAAGAAALAILLAASVRIATGAGRKYSFLVPSARHGFPAWMRGPFAAISSGLGVHGFVAMLALMSVAWVVCLIAAPHLPSGLGLGVVALLVAIFALAPPLLSTDVFNYVAYARMGVHGINPYAHGTIAFAHDASYPYVGHFWNHMPTAYGPLFTLLSYAAAPLGVAGAMWAFKAVAALATLGCVGLAWSCARRVGLPPLRAAFFIGLNPLVLVWAVGGGHNDALVALALIAAAWLVLRRRAATAGAAIAAGAAIKLSAGLALPFLVLGSRDRRRTVAGAALAGAVFALGGLAIFGTAMRHMQDALRLQERYAYELISVPGFVSHYLLLGHVGHDAELVMRGIFVAVSALLALRSLRTRGWVSAAAWSTLVLLVILGWVLPWYVLWLLPLVAIADSRVLVTASIALTLLIAAIWSDHYLLTGRHAHHEHAALRVTHPTQSRR